MPYNLTYWTGIEYLGLGLGAASYVKGYRFKNSSNLSQYVDFFQDGMDAGIQLPPLTKQQGGIFHALHEEIQALSLEEQMEEYMFLGLRLKKGVSISGFEARFQKTMDEVYGTIIENLLEKNLLKRSGDRLCLSQRGNDVANYVMSEFLFE